MATSMRSVKLRINATKKTSQITKAMNMISDGAKKVIAEMYGSFDKWLSLKIESSVNKAKK